MVKLYSCIILDGQTCLPLFQQNHKKQIKVFLHVVRKATSIYEDGPGPGHLVKNLTAGKRRSTTSPSRKLSYLGIVSAITDGTQVGVGVSGSANVSYHLPPNCGLIGESPGLHK